MMEQGLHKGDYSCLQREINKKFVDFSLTVLFNSQVQLACCSVVECTPQDLEALGSNLQGGCFFSHFLYLYRYVVCP